jgi:pre-mRNA cleavage complex 2 protein Pcf11
MQNILDDMQNDVNEIDKVSLERLADINPELLANIKSAAQEAIATSTSSTAGNTSSATKTSLRSLSNGNEHGYKNNHLPSFISEIRSDTILARSHAFQDYFEQQQKSWKPETEIADCQHRIQQLVQNRFEQLYTKTEALQMTDALATAVAVSKLLDHSWQQTVQNQQQQQLANMDSKSAKSTTTAAATTSATLSITTTSLGIDTQNFTNEGIKKSNPAVIGWLYEMGLPFVSSVDGRRFRTQTMLSQHLDRLFRRSQVEKSMARTEERGWYVPELVWTLEQAPQDPSWMVSSTAVSTTDPYSTTTTTTTNTALVEDTTALVPADESRDRCILCGIHFKMVFDNDQGVYCYSNCREIQVLNDDAAATESDDLLVHVTCWKGLGSPETITSDQTIQETLPHYNNDGYY